MSVYSRFKKKQGGFRDLVVLWETTPIDRRKKMIDVGMSEDPEYTMELLRYVMTFEDILNFPDEELAELVAAAQPRTTAVAIIKSSKDVQDRFIRCSKPPVTADLRDYLASNVTLREIGGAQLKLVEKARELEGKGYIKTKKIPQK